MVPSYKCLRSGLVRGQRSTFLYNLGVSSCHSFVSLGQALEKVKEDTPLPLLNQTEPPSWIQIIHMEGLDDTATKLFNLTQKEGELEKTKQYLIVFRPQERP